MHQTFATVSAALLAGCWIASSAVAQSRADATATLQDVDGNAVGAAEFFEAPRGTLLKVRFQGLPEGTHAFHVHETGECEPPFQSAGGHFNPYEVAHGFFADAGQHAGDLPNIHVPASGELELEIFSAFLIQDGTLLDEDGSALVVHAGADDYSTDPAGAAGERLACGVIEAGG